MDEKQTKRLLTSNWSHIDESVNESSESKDLQEGGVYCVCVSVSQFISNSICTSLAFVSPAML